MARKITQSKKQKRRILDMQQDVEFGINCKPNFIVSCPKCDKRAIDVAGRPERTIKIRHKCPHCSNIIVTPILAANAAI